MKTCLIVSLAAGATLGCGVLASSAQILQNGDFSANASAFSGGLHYSSDNNFVPITGWTESNPGAEGVEIEGDHSGSPTIFGPSSYTPGVDAAQFAFVQGNNTLSQEIALTLGGIYSVSFESATRSNTGGVPVLTVMSETDGSILATLVGSASTTAFATTTGTFVADGNDILVLTNVDPTGADLTADFTDVSVTIPEPSTSVPMLAGLGSLLAVAWRRRRRV